MKNLKYGLILFICSSMICFAIGEVFVRLVIPSNLNKRCLLFSSQTFQSDEHGAVRYRPDENIRTAAIYNGKIEYDVVFPTNNLGFVDPLDYVYENKSNKRYYAFIGDSFVAGVHGNDPWVPRLRDQFDKNTKDVEIYNLGVTGTGVEHFFMLLNSVKEQIHITDIVVVGISDDLRRTAWRPLTNSEEIRFCLKGDSELRCKGKPPVAKVIDFYASSDDILDVAKKAEKQKRGRYGNSPKSIAKNLIKQSRLLTAIVGLLKSTLNRNAEYFAVKYSGEIEQSLSALKKTLESFPSARLYYVHIPQKQEVLDQRYLVDMKSDIETLGIKYFPALTDCQWSNDMFYENDSHPNSYGYQNISNCVSGYLFSEHSN